MVVARDAAAQRREPSGIVLRENRAPLVALVPDSAVEVFVAPMIVGGVVAALATGALVWYGVETCDDFLCLEPVGWGIVFGGLAVPTGAYVGARRRGWLGRGVLTSYLFDLAGIAVIGLASSFTNAGIVSGLIAAGTVAAQISFCIYLERGAIRESAQR